MASQLQEVTSVLRSLLLASKHASTIEGLHRDYKEHENKNGIPYRELGFSTLEEFMKIVPGVRTIRRGGQLYVEVIATKESAHIAKLVADQANAKRRRGPSSRALVMNSLHKVQRYGSASGRSRVNNVGSAMQSNKSVSSSNGGNHASQPRSTTVTVYPPKPLMEVVVGPPPITSIQRPTTSFPPRASTVLDHPPPSPPSPPPPPPSTTTMYNPRLPPPIYPSSSATSHVTAGAPYYPSQAPRQSSEEQTAAVTQRSKVGDRLIIPAAATPTDPRESLALLIDKHHLPKPIYKSLPVRGKKGNEHNVYGQVIIGSSKYSSYPEEAANDTDAQILAATLALEELTKIHDTQIRPSSDRSLVKKRVIAIIDEHNGVFTHKIPTYYEALYRESLPSDWLSEVQQYSEIINEIGVNKTMILRRRVPVAEKPTAAQPSPKADKVVFLYPIGDACNPGILKLPEEKVWSADVRLVVSTTEIWARLYGDEYSERLEALTTEMKEHYRKTKYSPIETIKLGDYYAIRETDVFYRVQVLGRPADTHKVDVFFIDLGDVDTVSVSMLIPLEKDFCLLPGQAFKVSLAGLEEFANVESIVPIIDNILFGRTLNATEISRDVDADGPTASAVFYDTDAPEPININESILKMVAEELCTGYQSSNLNVEGQRASVNIVHVAANGDIFVNIFHEGLEYRNDAMNHVTKKLIVTEEKKKMAALSSISSIDGQSVYLARIAATDHWHRVKFVDATDSGNRQHLRMLDVDCGRTIIVDTTVDDILRLDCFSKTLAKFPGQAVRIRLQSNEGDSARLDDKLINKLVELAPPEQWLTLEVVKPGYDGQPATVQLFKETNPGVQISINHSLFLKPEKPVPNGDGNNNVRSRKRLERGVSVKTLKPPQISDIGDIFKVHVTMAANPDNFTVQPFDSSIQLSKMMSELQEACKAPAVSQLTLASIREGSICAAKHNDGFWYRVCVSNVVNEHMVTVYFCDFGDIALITLDNIKPLTSEFLQLPYQAIKAELAGVEPTNMDWSVEDCLRFQQLVVERNLVSMVVESTQDKHTPSVTVLGLRLYDTSTERDIDLAQLLINEGRAMPKRC